MKKYDIIFQGAGISGLLSAIASKVENPEMRIYVYEEKKYTKKGEIFYLTPYVRLVLASFGIDEFIPANEWNKSTQSLTVANMEGLTVDTPGLAIIDSAVIVTALQKYLQKISPNSVSYGEPILRVSPKDKTIVTSNETVQFEQLVVAIGAQNADSSIAIQRMYEPNLHGSIKRKIIEIPETFTAIKDVQIQPQMKSRVYTTRLLSPTADNLPSITRNVSRIGTAGGFVDFLFRDNPNFKVESAVVCGRHTAATLGKGNRQTTSFLELLNTTRNEIEATLRILELLGSNKELLHMYANEIIKSVHSNLLYKDSTYANLLAQINIYMKGRK